MTPFEATIGYNPKPIPGYIPQTSNVDGTCNARGGRNPYRARGGKNSCRAPR